MRRLASGNPCMLLAALLLCARLIAPAMAMPADPVELALHTICHADAPSLPDQPSQPEHTDCLLCPACHIAAQLALPTPNVSALPPPPVLAGGLGAPLPPAIGPPSRVRTPIQPTGPPTLSA